MSLSIVLLGGCGTISRPSFEAGRLVADAVIPSDSIRIGVNDAEQLQALAFRPSSAEAAHPGGGEILALSGGGANGAYGAGVIVGWTETGHRPIFDVVTGVSTGALAAPFAFLGPRWDGALQRAYLSGRTQRLVNRRNLAALVAPSLFSPHGLKS